MNFLPVVERELRAAARRKTTRRVRWWATLVGMLVSIQLLLLLSFSQGGASVGNPLFSILTGYAFLMCLFAGVFLTADSLSQERRDGTLGLLFLTDLHGYDVVLGKFMARSLSAFYLLFGLLPVIGLPLLLGGVTGVEFWRMALALVNALFFSLAIGILVSVFARRGQLAMGCTLGLLLLASAGLPALNELLSLISVSSGWTFFTWVSPTYPFVRSSEPVYSQQVPTFWASLLASQLLGWVVLGLAGYALPFKWREEYVRRNGRGLLKGLLRIGSGRIGGAMKRPAQLLALNPVLWLIGENRGLRWMLWVIVVAWGMLVISVCWVIPEGQGMLLYVGKFGAFLMKMLLAAQACAFFVEARRTGSLELLLSTPLLNRDIIKGQWMALRRLFLWPLLTFLFLSFIPLGYGIFSALVELKTSRVVDAILQGAGGGLMICWFGLGLVADAFAVCWVGMWLALSIKKPWLAPALTILFVLVLPSVGFCGLDLIADLFLILWAANCLQQDLRRVTGLHFHIPVGPPPPPLPPPWPPPRPG